MNNFMDYFVTKENYTNRGHWARARHVSEVNTPLIIPNNNFFFFLVKCLRGARVRARNRYIHTERKKKKAPRSKTGVCCTRAYTMCVCACDGCCACVRRRRRRARSRYLGYRRIRNNVHRSPGNVAALCALKSETPPGYGGFTGARPVPAPGGGGGGGIRYTRAHRVGGGGLLFRRTTDQMITHAPGRAIRGRRPGFGGEY